jgi:hypothetical protein
VKHATRAGLAALFCLAAIPAFADAIDGDWCSTAARRHLSIDGPRIVTPGGRALQGDYSRHGFAYTAPAGEAEAGRRVDLRLVNDRTMSFRPEGATADEIWNRCARPTS